MNGAVLLVGALAQGWVLDWEDNFDKPGLPDASKWNYETGYIRNDEKQYYTKARIDNARVEDGKLVITAQKDNFEGHPITSASLTTDGIKSWTYGRFEVRVKVPTGKGTWPAVWFLGDNIDEVGWPKCGEIDLMENVGYDPDKVHFNIHTAAYNHVNGKGKGANLTVADFPNDFHTYVLEWGPEKMDFFFDGEKAFSFEKEPNATVEQWPFDKPEHIKLNLAIGGGWGGREGVDDSIFPARYEIDYVKVYKRP